VSGSSLTAKEAAKVCGHHYNEERELEKERGREVLSAEVREEVVKVRDSVQS
jgi:hypothetical protein